ncbi:ATP-binding cassette domain-containing protein [Mucilaginibacter sp. BT774]|uniref:ATP-binding cassette domain-containing protein n=1 Tax=Mucilaginibacter sp. BT774 TaxID=3062276 RepID=UPI002675B08B|nr:ATP-binding cassette domain-containing protein [Mucilaginibacter sp. BT774]MDO3626408.1 ATP-binding cassette domain-containing protein [Mucilaginibacter sp. BT774]
MNTALLSVNHASLKLGNTLVFSDLNFIINRGEHWAVVGESGSGKSALLQTIAGKLHISAGDIQYNFHEDYLKEHRSGQAHLTFHKLIGFVEQRHHFRNLSNISDFYYQQRYNSSDSEDALTVEEYLGAIKHYSETIGYWDLPRVLQRLNLNALRSKQLIKLSNGETKRLLIAAALIKNPLILLLDNPLTGLDVQTRAEFNQIIAAIISSGISVIMATSPFEIPDAITHVAVLKDGLINQQVPAKEFDASCFAQVDKGKLDLEELSALLNMTTIPSYEWIVRMNNINITYSEKEILKNIDWQIKQGDRWALLGPNGAGKSTLLSLVNADNPQAYANDIILFDRKRGTGESIWDIKSKTGFISPELYQYFPTDNSCLQVIESGFYDTMGLFRPSDPKKSAIALRWMKALEIDRYARVLLKNIPASVQRLCLLARALIKNPTLLIFDEPCQGMDLHQQLHFKMLVDTICELSNVTLIYVTHYQNEIPDSVDKVLRLDKGKVV